MTTVTSNYVLEIASNTLYRFSDWPNSAVPRAACGVYAIWRDSRFVYAGMSGRGLSDVDIATAQTSGSTKGLYTRLKSHASGKRSGDQFCVYVADRIVLPLLSASEIKGIADGVHTMDVFIRRFIHEQLSYRYIVVPNGPEAARVEKLLRMGQWAHGKPYLNPCN